MVAVNKSEPGNEMPTTGGEIAYALSELAANKDVAKAIADWITAAARNTSSKPSLGKTALWLGLTFSLLIFLGVGLLGWFKVLSAEATAGLLGSLIGYWFGQRQRGN